MLVEFIGRDEQLSQLIQKNIGACFIVKSCINLRFLSELHFSRFNSKLDNFYHFS